MPIELSVSGVVPTLVSVTLRGLLVVSTFWAPNVNRLLLSFGFGLMFCALSGIDCGLSAAVSVITTVVDEDSDPRGNGGVDHGCSLREAIRFANESLLRDLLQDRLRIRVNAPTELMSTPITRIQVVDRT